MGVGGTTGMNKGPASVREVLPPRIHTAHLSVSGVESETRLPDQRFLRMEGSQAARTFSLGICRRISVRRREARRLACTGLIK